MEETNTIKKYIIDNIFSEFPNLNISENDSDFEYEKVIIACDALLCDSNLFFHFIDETFDLNNSLELLENMDLKLCNELKFKIRSYLPCYMNLYTNVECNKRGVGWFRAKNGYDQEYGPILKNWKDFSDVCKPPNNNNDDNDDKCWECLNVKYGIYTSKYKPLVCEKDIWNKKNIFKISYDLDSRELNYIVNVETCFCDSLLFKIIKKNPELINTYKNIIKNIGHKYFFNPSKVFDHKNCTWEDWENIYGYRCDCGKLPNDKNCSCDLSIFFAFL